MATFTQPGAQPASAFGATIDWGDGTSSAGVVTGGSVSYAVLGSHTYADEGAFPVTVTLTGPGTSLPLPTTATVLEQLLPDGSRGTPEQRFISEAFRDLFGRQVDQPTLSALTAVLAQGELQGLRSVLSNVLQGPFAPASLALFANPQLVQNLAVSPDDGRSHGVRKPPPPSVQPGGRALARPARGGAGTGPASRRRADRGCPPRGPS